MELPNLNLKHTHHLINEFLVDYGIEYSDTEIRIEKEWTDFRFTLKDTSQMERITTWLKDDIKRHLLGFSNVEIAAPIPVSGLENELRIRIYE